MVKSHRGKKEHLVSVAGYALVCFELAHLLSAVLFQKYLLFTDSPACPPKYTVFSQLQSPTW